MTAGHRMRTDKAPTETSRDSRRDDACLRATHVSDEPRVRRERCETAQYDDRSVNRHSKDDDLRATYANEGRVERLVHDALLLRLRQMLGVGIVRRDANATGGEI